MAFNVASSVASQYGGLLTPRDLKDPREILSTSGTEAFQRASALDQQLTAQLATTALDAQAKMKGLGMQLDYNRDADALIAAQKKKADLMNIAVALGGGGSRKAYDRLSGLGISPSMDPAQIANQLAGWNQYFAAQEDLLRKQVAQSTAGSNAGVSRAIKGLQGE